MTCQEILDFLMQYIEGELPVEQLACFEEHLHVCGPCVDYLKTYKETIRLGQAACAEDNSPCKQVPEELIQAILAARRAQCSGG
jgi:predicted anti-sigma-YlaC factor YlaD